MSWFATNLIATFLLPPLSLLILIAAGYFFRSYRIARGLGITAFILLLLASTPYFSEGAMRLIEPTPVDMTEARSASAIVILGGGTYFHAPEYSGEDTVNEETLARLRYGARLERELHLPVLVTGGRPLGNSVAEALQMRSALEQDFGVPVRWVEAASDNTYENARNSFLILQKEHITRICLVTHASHMMRAASAFRRAGFEVIEAPAGYTTRYHTDLLTFLPRAKSLRQSSIFVHETVGMLWYRARSIFSQ